MRTQKQKLYFFSSQIFFTVMLSPLFLFPRMTQTKLMRRIIAFSFGSLIAKRYDLVIKSFGDLYGAALKAALERADSISAIDIKKVIDCGTGSGFAAREVAAHFPEATVSGFDIIPEMLEQAQKKSLAEGLKISYVQSDVFCLPLKDNAVDLVVAQNTVPFLSEYARVCRPGGIIVFVDTTAQWITSLAERAARRTECFDLVESRACDPGFYLIARRRSGAQAEPD
jgi:SAM-dependent methyltransferase